MIPTLSALKTSRLKILFFLLFALGFFFLGKEAVAQVPEPYVSCDDTDSPEFHSLRPYQKSPCNREVTQTANFCGNRLVLTDTVTQIQRTPPRFASNCTDIGNNRYRCNFFVFNKTASYQIDLSNAELPILGNTQGVTNSQNQDEELDDADKVNDYVSWYLSGVTGKAEYSPADADTVVNYSGPLKKLLPWSTQNQYREDTVKAAREERHNQVIGCVNLLGQITNCYPQRAGVREIRLSAWRNNLPPKREEFDNFDDFWIEYKRWRGNSCISIFGANLCVNNPLKPDWPGNLYSYIPMASTEDRVGEVAVESQNVSAASDDLIISDVSLFTTPAELFFSHTEEASGLAEKLQLTFAPQENPLTGAPSLVSPAESCDLTNIRTNEGDDLFAESIEGTLTYDAEFSCEFSGNATSSACTKDVSVGLGVTTKTPKADELWSRLVAGPSSVFKRIFPRVGEGGALLGVLDMPASTKVTYSGSGLVSAGNPGARSGEDAELYFPHIGGISEYFLKGIQTILRPKGFGEPILSGALGTFASSGAIDCNQSAPDISLRRTLNREQTFQLALNWVAGQSGNHVMECYNDTVGRAKDSGFNAALILLIWLNESNASNYNISPADFGIRSLDNQGYNAQITQFLQLPSYYRSVLPQCFGRGSDTMAFLRIFRSGNCTDQDGLEYANGIRDRWNWVSACAFPQSPTDTSCP